MDCRLTADHPPERRLKALQAAGLCADCVLHNQRYLSLAYSGSIKGIASIGLYGRAERTPKPVEITQKIQITFYAISTT